MKGPEPREDATFHEPKPVVAAVAVKIGVKAGDDRNAEPAGDAEGTPAEGAFSGDVDAVRRVFPPESAEDTVCGEAEAEFGVAGNGDARDSTEEMGCLRSPRAVRTGRGDDGDLDASLVEAGDEAPEGHGDPVDFGWEGFGDQRQFQNGSWKDIFQGKRLQSMFFRKTIGLPSSQLVTAGLHFRHNAQKRT